MYVDNKTLAFFIVLEKISNLPIVTFQMYLNTYNFTKGKYIYIKKKSYFVTYRFLFYMGYTNCRGRYKT